MAEKMRDEPLSPAPRSTWPYLPSLLCHWWEGGELFHFLCKSRKYYTTKLKVSIKKV